MAYMAFLTLQIWQLCEKKYHFLLKCPLHNQLRDQTITLLPEDIKNDVTSLISGNTNKSVRENGETFSVVGKFDNFKIIES